MFSRTKVRVIYDQDDSYDNHGSKVEEILEKDIGGPVPQTKSIPPFIRPVDLTEMAIDELKALSGIKVEKVDN
ncbi:hypothetical protein O988_05095 [Pseudogymnoascus sp. VKM F-3808]|nr:hypothetical protein O988_05095 [Pseudogymnoascus sp. VKM F-3808]